MSGSSSFGPSGSSGLPGDPPGLAPNTAAKLGAGLTRALSKTQSGEQPFHPSSPPRTTGSGVAFVRSSTTEAVALSPSQGVSQEPFARGGGGDADEVCDCADCVAKRVAAAGPPPLSQGFLNALRPKKPSADEEKAAAEALAIAKAAAQAMVDHVTHALGILQARRLPPALLCRTIFFTIGIYEGSDSDRLFLIIDLFRDILHSVGGQLLQSASDICHCNLCRVRFFMRIFHPNPVPDPELELARLFWRRAFETPDFPEIREMIFRFLQEQLQILEISRRLYMLFEELGGFGGGHQNPPPRTPKAMPQITQVPDACQFNQFSSVCAICREHLSGECLMSQCKHALHSTCMSAMFKSGIDVCPSCRKQIKTLVSATLEESPKASEDSPKASDDSSAGGASADAAPESPKASEE